MVTLFFNPEYADDFFESLFSELHFYYHEMPLLIKLDLITKTPFSSVMRGAIKKITQPVLVENTYVRLDEYTDRFSHGDRGDYSKTITAGKNTEILDCNGYLFSQYLTSESVTFNGQRHILSEEFKKRGFVISDAFKSNLRLLKKLQQRGVHILFTWPVVVGENCYQGEYGLLFSAFLTDIKSYLRQNGMLIVGEPKQSQFSSPYFFNSYYHVIPAGRDKRTRVLIAEIKKSKANDWFKKTLKSNHQLKLNLTVEKNRFLALLKPIKAGEKITINASNQAIEKAIFMVSGWHPIEDWGVWSQNTESVFYLKLSKPLLTQDVKLIIENELFNPQDNTHILINDKSLGDYLLVGKKAIFIPKSFLTQNGLVKIQLRYKNVKSGLELGLNQDERKIKLGLKSLQFFPLANEKR